MKNLHYFLVLLIISLHIFNINAELSDINKGKDNNDDHNKKESSSTPKDANEEKPNESVSLSSSSSPSFSSPSSLSGLSNDFPESRNKFSFFPNSFRDTLVRPEILFQEGLAESLLARRLKEVLDIIRPLILASSKIKFKDYPYYYESDTIDFNVQRPNGNLPTARFINIPQFLKPLRRTSLLFQPQQVQPLLNSAPLLPLTSSSAAPVIENTSTNSEKV